MVRWHGEAFRRRLEQEMTRRVTAACILVLNRARELLNVEGAAKQGKGQRLKYGADRSKPGEPPRKQTGNLLGRVQFEVSDMRGRVGTNVKYGLWLEVGTKVMAARPWLRRALNEVRGEIAAIFARPMK